jgi:hypothetical protein
MTVKSGKKMDPAATAGACAAKTQSKMGVGELRRTCLVGGAKWRLNDGMVSRDTI